MSSRDRLIVALDVANADDARRLVAALDGCVTFYKIGLELLFSGGLDLAAELKRRDKRVFLDLKFLDIGNTVTRAVANAAELGFDFLTVHGQDAKTLRAATAGKGATGAKLLAVTVLTNLGQGDLAEQGCGLAPAELALRRARMAKAAGCDGVVASGQEAARIREAVGPNLLLVTPGIRLPGGVTGDQERVTSPQYAIASGADYIVVGRPVTEATDPRLAAETFIQHIEKARA